MSLFSIMTKATAMLNFKNIRISRTLHDIKSKCCTHINVATPFLKLQDGDDRLFSHLRNGQRCCVLTEFGLRKNKFILDHFGRALLMLAIFNIPTIYFTSHISETVIHMKSEVCWRIKITILGFLDYSSEPFSKQKMNIKPGTANIINQYLFIEKLTNRSWQQLFQYMVLRV